MSDKEKAFYQTLSELLKENEFVTAKMLAEITEMPNSTVRRYLTRLSETGIINSDGKNKGKKYYLK